MARALENPAVQKAVADWHDDLLKRGMVSELEASLKEEASWNDPANADRANPEHS
jgi:hypothetical protein